MTRIKLFFLFLIELFIFFAQLFLLVLIPIDPYREWNSDGKVKSYMPLFLFLIVIIILLNTLFSVFAFIKQKFNIKKYIFLCLLFIYLLTVSSTLFLEFGYKLREFEIKTFFILLGYNSILLIGYLILYKQLTKK